MHDWVDSTKLKSSEAGPVSQNLLSSEKALVRQGMNIHSGENMICVENE